ncbi:MAG TPA: heme-binding protein [Gemmatimonas sp.]|nr:heme-binding protein [Gemmatimonas sp.]
MRLLALSRVAPLLLAVAVAIAAPAHAQPQPPAARITLDDAKRAVDAAEAEAVKNGWKLVFLITDAQDKPIYLRRMDGVPTRNYEIAVAKTHTAHKSRMHTVDYAAAVKAGKLQAIEGATNYEGGLLLRRDGQVIGAFSASGATGAQDAQAVKAGMSAIGITP